MPDLTPAMRQYSQLKQENPDCLVLFRMGDFYETFYEDAKTASRVLGITLTSRGKGSKRAPLAGIPYHSLEQHLTRLVKAGYKVALVEQLEDPKEAKGLVKRGLVRIVTPGTVIEESILSGSSNNFIGALWRESGKLGLAFSDISTGDFLATETDMQRLLPELARLSPSELIFPESYEEDELSSGLRREGYSISYYDDRHFWKENAAQAIKEQFGVQSLEGFGLDESQPSCRACGALVSYMRKMYGKELRHLKAVRLYSVSGHMTLDSATIRNLELLRNMRDNSQRGSLFEVLNRTSTPMGARRLKSWIQKPLLDTGSIRMRLDAVGELKDKALLREEMREKLRSISDIERILARVSCGTANPRDIIALRDSLRHVPELKKHLKEFSSHILADTASLSSLDGLAELISKALKDDPPTSAREGGIIRKGFDSELDRLREVSRSGKSWISDFEEKERKRTGIRSLKVRYNRIFGYFIEVTKPNLRLVPQDYIRKQTQVNSERFVTEELKEKESLVLGAHEKICSLEHDIFLRILDEITLHSGEIQGISERLSVLDSLLSLAQAASEHNYNRPDFGEDGRIIIEKGRHPVVELSEAGSFVPNDTSLGGPSLIHIITGPNMAGKSTYLRQVALICLMAQAGSFVSADSARLAVIDRIFTRVGAVDDLSLGRSTFMVEMSEVANIVNNATPSSLILMDEVGRGTSTYDGISLAWAIVEYIDDFLKPKTLFATHYHHLNRLAEERKSVRNFNIAVSESEGGITFLRKIVPGGTDKSYGIHVARIAGMPARIVKRAEEIQARIEANSSRAAGTLGLQEGLTGTGSVGQGSSGQDEAAEELHREIRITETITKKKRPRQMNLFEVIEHRKD